MQSSGIGTPLNTKSLCFQLLKSDNTYKIGVGINYYDDLHGLAYMLMAKPGFYDQVDKIYLIDGRYKGREDLPQYNPDDVKQLIKDYPKVQYFNMNGYSQIDKRNTYWDCAEADDLDFMIVLDSDEYLHITDKTVLHQLIDREAKCFPIKQHQQDICSMSRPRLFKKPFTFRHRENRNGNGISHGSLYEDYGESDKEIIAQMYFWFKDHPKREINTGNQTGIPGFQMYHDKQFRNKERIIADRVYYDETPNR